MVSSMWRMRRRVFGLGHGGSGQPWRSGEQRRSVCGAMAMAMTMAMGMDLGTGKRVEHSFLGNWRRGLTSAVIAGGEVVQPMDGYAKAPEKWGRHTTTCFSIPKRFFGANPLNENKDANKDDNNHKNENVLKSDVGNPEDSKNLNFISYYDSLIKNGTLRADPAQRHVAITLNQLCEELKEYQKKMQIYNANLREWNEKRRQMRIELIKEDERKEKERDKMVEERRMQFGVISRWFSKPRKSTPEKGVGKRIMRLKREKEIDAKFPLNFSRPLSPKSIYLYGSVGSGKTLLMDMFYTYIKQHVSKYTRMHFNAAMLDIHSRMHKEFLKDKGINNDLITPSQTVHGVNDDDKYKNLAEQEINELKDLSILERIGEKIIKNDNDNSGACVICFDEIQIVDVFTALLISKLFDYFIQNGVVIVSTSNKPLFDLNKDGFQREIFAEFVNSYSQKCKQVLIQSAIDYRRLNAKDFYNNSLTSYYYFPNNKENKIKFENLWESMTNSKMIHSSGKSQMNNETNSGKVIIPVRFGRTLEVCECRNGVAKFSFQFLCSNPLGSADYLAISESFHTIFLHSIPVMSEKNKDEARRFITLIDELYNNKCRLICLSESSIDDLFTTSGNDSIIVDYESIQFEAEVEKKGLRLNVLRKETSFSALNSNEGLVALQNLLEGKEEQFAFKRAMSRLIEMQTPTYDLLRSHAY